MKRDQTPRDDDAGISKADHEERVTRLVLCRCKLSASEAALLRKVFPEIVRAHRRQVWAQLRERRIGRANVEDLFQEVFLSLHAAILEEGFPDSVAGWLRKVTEGKLLNYLRGKKREPFSLGLPSSGSEPPRTPPDLERAMDRQDLPQRALQLLSEEHRAVVEKVILEELTYDEAAEALDIPLGTLKKRLIHAKRRLVELAEQLLSPRRRVT